MDAFTYLKNIDQQIIVFINGLNSPFFDEFMWLVSGKLIWFPFYIFLLILVYRKVPLNIFILFFIVGIASIGFADLFANYGLKHTIQRYRPSHNLNIGHLLHFYEIKPGDFYKGGQFGFVSGHATNSFAIVFFFGLFLKKYHKNILKWLTLWAILICYSRMYLGVHYLSDLIGGFVVGTSIAYLGHKTFMLLANKKFNHKFMKSKYQIKD